MKSEEQSFTDQYSMRIIIVYYVMYVMFYDINRIMVS